MRDLIWTVIIIWVIWKLVDIFRSAGSRKRETGQVYAESKKQKDDSRKKSADTEGEYVDFEEIK